METEPDWGAWSRDAVRLAQERNDSFIQRFGLHRCPYQWDFERAQIVFRSPKDEVVAEICVVGSTSVSAGTFLWAWANDAIPSHARMGLEAVREFGLANALDRLTTAEWAAGPRDGLEMAAVACRVLDGAGTWTEPGGDVTLFFVLRNLRTQGS
jgi:hypothetical protein